MNSLKSIIVSGSPAATSRTKTLGRSPSSPEMRGLSPAGKNLPRAYSGGNFKSPVSPQLSPSKKTPQSLNLKKAAKLERSPSSPDILMSSRVPIHKKSEVSEFKDKTISRAASEVNVKAAINSPKKTSREQPSPKTLLRSTKAAVRHLGAAFAKTLHPDLSEVQLEKNQKIQDAEQQLYAIGLLKPATLTCYLNQSNISTELQANNNFLKLGNSLAAQIALILSSVPESVYHDLKTDGEAGIFLRGKGSSQSHAQERPEFFYLIRGFIKPRVLPMFEKKLENFSVHAGEQAYQKLIEEIIDWMLPIDPNDIGGDEESKKDLVAMYQVAKLFRAIHMELESKIPNHIDMADGTVFNRVEKIRNLRQLLASALGLALLDPLDFILQKYDQYRKKEITTHLIRVIQKEFNNYDYTKKEGTTIYDSVWNTIFDYEPLRYEL